MIEYLYNAIRATAGEDIVIAANITDDEGNVITNCDSKFTLFDDEGELFAISGSCSDCWEYNIPAIMTQELKGRYWYCICANGSTLQFKQPIYFV
jgi:hypothetical protein